MSTHPTTVTAPEGLPYIDVVRDFDAPPAAVFRAWTDPSLVAQWLRPDRLTMEIDHYDARTGGSWAYSHRGPDGEAYAFHGTFHSVVPDESITQTFEFGGYPGHASLERLTFEPLEGGGTRTRSHAVFESVEDRDGMIASGMEGGLSEGYAHLDDLLAAP
ncbi:SRPBCC family protein [Cellulomonas sp. PhB143]|uniref:SRPBCC family protein n=1 Tax=Cellulomonas sp. PhB143 TaxID=2485186 RepID=UPI000F485D26|nr:SRPBCC family protein [Cellulomonas sp. PhB143]ROS75298.1 uncharacterized protein YndB with AHSA1/START domain [Cellulomonas sp. PhB143]